MTRTDTPATGPVRGTAAPPDPVRRPRWHLSGYDPRLLRRDGLLAALAVAAELLLYTFGPTVLTTADWPTRVLWSVLGALPVVFHRAAHWGAVALAVAVFAGTLLDRHEPLTVVVTFVLLTYSAAAHHPPRRAVLATVVLWVPLLASALTGTGGADPISLPTTYVLFTNILIALVCFLVGRTVHARRVSMRVLEERARAAEENQRTLAHQAVADERRRIARELHDVVAHHVSVMGVLATGARRVLPRNPEVSGEALDNIAETSRTALRELRRLLDVLRTDAEPAADLTPQPGLAGIELLVDQVREAGLPVALRVDGVPATLEPGLALTVFRIVQEALTNALKHAGTATAQVRLSYGVYWLIVEVFDTGRGPSLEPNRIGHGLVGMRERVALYGGTLRTGPRPGGGFRVYAKMPLDHVGTPSSEERS